MKYSDIRKSDNLTAALAAALLVAVSIYIIFHKNYYFVDEIFTYGLANHNGGVHIQLLDKTVYRPIKDEILYYLAAQRGELFNYHIVWLNQINDVHPPLYYCILHTISSFFPNTFSKWYAGSINIFFSLLTLYCFVKILGIFTIDRKYQIILSVLYIFNAGILNVVSFLRMYSMTMFWNTYLTYLLISGKTDNRKYMICFCASIFLSALTHYYCIVYSLLLLGVYSIFNFGKGKKIILLDIRCAVMFVLAYICFPAMKLHLLASNRGQESLANLVSSDYLSRMITFLKIINRQLFCGMLPIFVIVLLYLLYRYRKIISQNDCEMKISLVTGYRICLYTIILYFLFVAKTAPYLADRYLFPIYPLILLIFLIPSCKMIKDIRFFHHSRSAEILFAVFVLLFSANSFYRGEYPYLYEDKEDMKQQILNHKNADCICIYDLKWKLESDLFEYINYDSLQIIQSDNLEPSDLDYLKANKSFIVRIIDSKVENRACIADSILDILGDNWNAEFLFRWGYGDTYNLTRK